MSLFKVLTEALNHFIEYGYDSQSALEDWLRKLKDAAIDSLTTPRQLQTLLEKSLRKTFDRLVNTDSLVSGNVSRYDINRIKPALRAELDRRILASANLIKLNREEAINTTLRRFSGWATSITLGGTKSADRIEEKKDIRKSLSKIRFQERRVIIDQTHKLVASINDIVAVNNGAIAAEWHSHWKQAGYNYRKDHKERDDKIYIIRDSWANKEHWVKAINGYTDDITTPGEEVYCRCYYRYIYTLNKLPDEMLTEKALSKRQTIDK